MKKSINRILLSIAILFFLQMSTPAQKKDLLFSFCNFEMGEELIQKNTNSTESFSFAINEGGKPIEFKRVLGKYVDLERVEECTDNWRFVGFGNGARGVIVFSWEHGQGWVSMQVKSQGLYRLVLNRPANSKP